MVGIPVVRVVGRELEMPLARAGRRVERQQRIGVEVVAFAFVAVVVGIRVAGGPVQRIERRIVRTGHPRGAAAAGDRIGALRPRVAAGFTRRRHRVVAPDARAGGRIVGIDEAARGVFAARDPHDHLVADDERRQRRRVAHLVVGEHDVPHHAAGQAVERQQMGVEGDHEQPIPEHGEAAVDRGRGSVREIVRQVAAVLPERPPGAAVECPGKVVRSGHVEHAVPRQRRGFEAASARHRAGLERPLRGQPVHVGRRDLGEGTVAPARIVARERHPAFGM